MIQKKSLLTALAVALSALLFTSLTACERGNGAEPAAPKPVEPAGEPAATESPEAETAESAAAESEEAESASEIPPRADDSDRKSKNGRAEGTIDGVGVIVTYGRPEARGRTLWGELVPFGEVWRTGADEATTITFDADVEIEGEALEAGTYALFTIPGEESWTVIFNRVAKQWGAYKYDEAEDALRVEVAPSESDEHVEALIFEIEEGKVVLRWGKREVAFGVAPA